LSRVTNARIIDQRTVMLPIAGPGGRGRPRRTHLRHALRQLDRRILPPMAAVLTRLARSGLRSRRILAALAAVAAVTAVVLAVYTATRKPASTTQPTPTVTIGAKAGDNIPAYVAIGNRHLQQMIHGANPPAGVYALVAFKKYLDPGDTTTLLHGVQVAEVFLRVPPADLAGLDPPTLPVTKVIQVPATVLPTDLLSAMDKQAAHLRTTASDLATMLTMVDDGPDDAALRVKYADARALADAEATEYANRCKCVYAAIVYGSPQELGDLDQSEVRVVDAFASSQPPALATFVPPVPDQKDTATPPPVDDGTSP
jgi:hypothetical protein